MRHVAAAALLAALLLPRPSAAQGSPLTLDEALELARARAAGPTAAGARVEEARARLVPASRRLRENPVLELAGGPRRGEESSTEYEASVSQGFEPAVRRRARIAGAEAALATAEAELADARRLVLGEVAAAFYRALETAERLRLSGEARRLADDLLASTERRSEMGEATALELNRVRTEAARARADESSAAAVQALAYGGLAGLLGLPADGARDLAGSLRDLPAYELPALLARAGGRPDLLALAAGVREAEAEVRLGEALARPGFGVRTAYEREEGADVVTAGVAVALPAFQRGQEEVAVGRARATGLRARLEVVRSAAEAEVRTAFAAYRQHLDAVEELERTALPAVADNEALAQRSYEVGEIDLGELLLIRREILETRRVHLDLLLAARLAAVELETSAGGLR